VKREQALVPVGVAAGIAAYFHGLSIVAEDSDVDDARVHREGIPLVGSNVRDFVVLTR